MPFIFVADKAFTLSDHVQWPFRQRNLSIGKDIYNYRLTRARRIVECTFGIMANKWRILHRALDVNLQFCHLIIQFNIIINIFIFIKE